MSQQESSVNLHIYGLDIRIHSVDGRVIEGIHRDFRYFEAQTTIPDVDIEVYNEKPPYHDMPDLRASIYSPNYVSFRGRKCIFTDYHGRGLRIYHPAEKRYRIFSDDSDLRHEISYLTVLSVAGQFLDERHIHRVHALGISQNGKAVLILLPEKGGKTTLALRLLRSEHVKLLSEDSPLITRKGQILPFPLRLGIVPGGETGIPSEYLYPVNFTRVGTKLLVDPEYFTDKISSVCKPGAILLGERVLGCGSEIKPANKMSAVKEFTKNSVIGMGLHQGMEYLLGANIWQTISKGGLAFSRMTNSLKVVNGSKVYSYLIGHDSEFNVEVLLCFLQKLKL